MHKEEPGSSSARPSDGAPRELERQNAQLQAVYAAMNDGVVVFDAAGQVLLVNEAEARLCGYPSADDMKRDLAYFAEVFELFELDGTPLPVERWPVTRVLRGERIRNLELGARRKDTGQAWIISFSGEPVLDADGRLTLAVLISSDVTDRVRRERALRDDERRFRALADSMPQLVWTANAAGIVDYYNARAREYGGIEEAPDGTWRWQLLVHPDDLALTTRAWDAAVESGAAYACEHRVRMADGQYRWHVSRARLVRGPGSGDAGGTWYGTATDIHERKLAEEGLRRNEAEARSSARFALRVIDRLFAFVGVLDRSGTLLDANEAPLAAAGIGIDDVRGKKFWDCYWWTYAPEVSERVRAACERAAQGHVVRFDVVVRMAGDSRMTIDFQIAPLHDHAGEITHLIPSAVDITERERAEQDLRESEARFRALADNIAQLSWIADATGYIGWYNRRWFEYTGTRLDEMAGWGWQKVHHPEHVERVTQKFRAHVGTGEPWEDTFPLRSARGEYRWFLSRAIPIRDDAGRVVRWFGTNTDVTEQRAAEEAVRSMNDRLEEADRRKDGFIAMLAHELRNPLAPVRTAVHLLKRLGPAEPRLERARDIIDRQVTHMARLIDDLLDVSRIARGKLALQKETCDVAALARQTAEDYRASLEQAGLTVRVSAPPGPLWVEGDPVRLTQMIGNLLTNAGRFTDAGGRVEVRTLPAPDGASAIVSVTDTGVGIAPELLARLFDPFSQADQDLARTKGGLGLGLALTKGLAELHGGQVIAESEGPGRGATFRLLLPRARGPQAPTGAEAAPRDGAGLRVLVVEDNRDAAETLRMVLELQGHEVKVAFDGAGGIAAARAFAPEVVISDIGLPGELDGYAVARALRAEPGLRSVRLIALSGYVSEEARRKSREAGFDAHLGKPPDLETLEALLSLSKEGA